MNSSFQFPESLTDRYRPRRVDDFCGIPQVKTVLKNFLKNPRSSVWLFFGPSGRGKTRMGMAIRDYLNAELHHIPSRNCDKQTIEETVSMCHRVPWVMFGPGAGKPCRFHLILVDEIDRASPVAQDSLLSLTDETAFPPQTIFIFTANDTERLEPRLLSRMHRLNFDAEGMNTALPKYLARVAAKEKCKAKLDFSRLARDVDYNVRDALMKLEIELMGASYLSDGSIAGDLKASRRK
jgi:replication-associated recombination protein RarA